jgi:hypothetical protein
VLSDTNFLPGSFVNFNGVPVKGIKELNDTAIIQTDAVSSGNTLSDTSFVVGSTVDFTGATVEGLSVTFPDTTVFEQIKLSGETGGAELVNTHSKNVAIGATNICSVTVSCSDVFWFLKLYCFAMTADGASCNITQATYSSGGTLMALTSANSGVPSPTFVVNGSQITLTQTINNSHAVKWFIKANAVSLVDPAIVVTFL